MQEKHNSIANALELRLSCTKPSLWYHYNSASVDIIAKCWIVNKQFLKPMMTKILTSLSLCEVKALWLCLITTNLMRTIPQFNDMDCIYKLNTINEEKYLMWKNSMIVYWLRLGLCCCQKYMTIGLVFAENKFRSGLAEYGPIPGVRD